MSHSMDHDRAGAGHGTDHGMGRSMGRPWLMLAAMTVIHVAIMYVLMFAMIDRGADFVNNVNMFYMAVLMAAPITAAMVLGMWGMYPGKGAKVAVVAVSLIVGLLSWLAIRQQWEVDDRQFLRSMIPHHSGAILMCQEASISDPRILELCDVIIAGQRSEIEQMEALLAEPAE